MTPTSTDKPIDHPKLRIGLDLHNLSTREDLSLRTGIQQVVFGLLGAQHRIRGDLIAQDLELRPLPMLPSFFSKSQFSNLSPSHVNNSHLVLKEVAAELGCDSKDLWSDAIDERNLNWKDADFYDACEDLDWLIITGLCEFRHVAEALKLRNPKLKIAVLAYDLGPMRRPELVAQGMTEWFRDSYLESIRLYADIVFTISRHTAIDCIDYFSLWPEFKGKVWSTPLPPEPPALQSTNSQKLDGFLQKHGLTKGKFFVAIGTIEPRKNLGIAVLGFNRFRSIDPKKTKDFRFVLIGKQGWRNEDTRILDMIGDSADQFIFPGYLPREDVELAILLSAGLVMPSRLEGFGLPIALAHAYGVPTITCNNTSLPEASNVSSLYVTTDNPDIMAMAMWKLAAPTTTAELPTQADLEQIRANITARWDQYLCDWIDCITAVNSAVNSALISSSNRPNALGDLNAELT